MKLTVPCEALTSALARVNRVIEKRSTIVILGNVLLRARNGALSLTGTNLDAEITTTVAAEIAAEGETTLHASTFYDFARKLPKGGTVTLEEKPGEGRCTVRAGRTHAALHTLPAADYTALSSDDPAARFSLPADTLAGILGRVAYAASTEETRYYLCGVHIHIGREGEAAPAQLHFVATDGHRLSHEYMPAPDGAEALPPIIIPSKAAATLAGMLRGLPNAPVEIAASRHYLTLTAGTTTLGTKLIDGTFPDYTRVIPHTTNTVATLVADDLQHAVALLTTLSSTNGRAVQFGFGAEAESLRLAVTNAEAGSADHALAAEIEGEPVTIRFNGRYVEDMLTQLPGTRVSFAMSDPLTPARLTAAGHEGWEGVIMPMRE